MATELKPRSNNCLPVCLGEAPEIKANVVGPVKQRMQLFARAEIVQRQAKAAGPEQRAGFDQFRSRIKARWYSQNRQSRRENQHPPLDKSLRSAGNKGRQTICQVLESENHFIVEHGLNCQPGIPVDDSLGSTSEEQIVSVYAPLKVQNRLACNITKLASQLWLSGSDANCLFSMCSHAILLPICRSTNALGENRICAGLLL